VFEAGLRVGRFLPSASACRAWRSAGAPPWRVFAWGCALCGQAPGFLRVPVVPGRHLARCLAATQGQAAPGQLPYHHVWKQCRWLDQEGRLAA